MPMPGGGESLNVAAAATIPGDRCGRRAVCANEPHGNRVGR